MKKIRPNQSKKLMHIVLSFVLNAAAFMLIWTSSMRLLCIINAIWLGVTFVMLYYYITCYYQFEASGVTVKEGNKRTVVPYKKVYQVILASSYPIDPNQPITKQEHNLELRLLLCSAALNTDIISADYTAYGHAQKDANANAILCSLMYSPEILNALLYDHPYDILVPLSLYEEKKNTFELLFRTHEIIDDRYVLLNAKR